MAKITNIEWMQLTREFYCPCCDTPALDADGKPVLKPCSHFLFNYQGWLGDFVDYAECVESILDDVTLDITGPTDISLVAALPASTTIYQIEVRDHACGPIVHADTIAFDPLAI